MEEIKEEKKWRREETNCDEEKKFIEKKKLAENNFKNGC